MEPVIFKSTTPPNFTELCALSVFVRPPSRSNLTSQACVLKCREFIFSEASIIASPSFDLDSCFNIIMQKSFFKTGRLQARLQKMSLEFSKPFQVQQNIYQSCLRYTVMARMAPSWNKAGEWFIQGREFVAHHGYSNAIKMKLCVNKEEIYASICGTVVYCSPLQIEDLNLSRQEILDILKSTEIDGQRVELHDSWCHVLPSMKKGRVQSVSLLIPGESPFKGYADLKRYWKNTYGYRLPQTDEDMFYCQVSFSPSGNGKQFTYPDVCLRNRLVQPVNRVDPKPILTDFLQDMHSRVGFVCGQALQFTPKMHFPVVSFHDADEKEAHINLNLANKRRSDCRPVPLRSSQNILLMNKRYENNHPPVGSCRPVELIKESNPFQENEEKGGDKSLLYSSNSSVINNSNTQFDQDKNEFSLSKCHSNLQENHSSNSAAVVTNFPLVNSQNPKNNKCDELKSPQPSNSSSSSKLKLSDTVQSNSGEKTLSDKCKNKNIPDGKSCSQPPASGHRFVPIFRAKQNIVRNYQKTIDKNLDTCTTSIPKITPIFKARQRSTSTTKPNQSTHSTILKDTTNPTSKHQQVHKPKLVPVSKGNSNLASKMSSIDPSNASIYNLPLLSPQAPRSIPAFPTLSKPSISTSHLPSNSSQTSKINKLFSVSEEDSKINLSLPGSPQRKSFPTFKSQSSKYPSLHSPQSFNFMSKSNSISSQVAVPSRNSAPVNLTPTSQNKTPLQGKRMLQHPDPDTPKKARSKPQLQNLDIEALARSNQLDKANTMTLMTWLKEKGINCKSRDKKSVLIEKIMTHLNLSAPEP